MFCCDQVYTLMHDYYYSWYHPYGWHNRHYGLYDGGAFIFFILLIGLVFIGLAACLPWDTSTYQSTYYNSMYHKRCDCGKDCDKDCHCHCHGLGHYVWKPDEEKQHDTKRLMF